jgi:predicted DNA binding protein
MTVVAEVALPCQALPPGDLLADNESVEVRLFEFVPLDEGPMPYFWLHNDSDAFERLLRADQRVERVRVLDRFDDAALYRVGWTTDVEFGLVDCLGDDSVLEGATGTADGWTVRLRFTGHEALSAFRDRCGEAGLRVEVARIFHPGPPGDGATARLTEPQREALVLARERGYFDDPRGTTLAELGSELGITRQAVSYRIRRGVRHLVDAMLLRP